MRYSTILAAMAAGALKKELEAREEEGQKRWNENHPSGYHEEALKKRAKLLARRAERYRREKQGSGANDS